MWLAGTRISPETGKGLLVPIFVGLGAIAFGVTLGMGSDIASDERRYVLPALLLNGLLLVGFPDIFFGLSQTHLLGDRGYIGELIGADIRFLPFLPLLAAAIHLVRNDWKRFPSFNSTIVLTQIVFLALMALGLVYTSDPQRGLTLLWRFAYYNFLLCALPMAFGRTPGSLRNIAYGFGAGSVVVGLSAVLAWGKVWSGEIPMYHLFITFFDERMAGAGVVFMAWLLATRKARGAAIPLLAIALAVLMFDLVLLGRRGILLGTVLGVIACVFLAGQTSPRNSVLISALAMILWTSFLMVPEPVLDKSFSPASYSGEYTSSQSRLRIYEETLAGVAEAPLLGHGTGTGYGSELDPGAGFNIYPHNTFLEIAYQLGVVGALVLAAFLLSVGLAARRVLKSILFNQEQRFLAGLLASWFIVFLVPAMLSFNIIENRGLWFVGGLIGALAAFPIGASDRRPLEGSEAQASSLTALGAPR